MRSRQSRFCIAVAVAVLTLSACGGGGSSKGASNGAPSPSGSQPPQNESNPPAPAPAPGQSARYTLAVVRTGEGSVTSSPAGINCGTACGTEYTSGTVVVLNAAASAGRVFNGWGGACSGTGACTVTMSDARSVTAAFGMEPPPPSTTRPNASNTGVPAGTVLQTWSGPQWDGRSDLVVDGYDLADGHTFAGNNVVLRNCRLRRGVLLSGDNVRIERCEIIDGVSLSGTAGVVLAYNNIHSFGADGIHLTSDSGRASDVTIVGNFIHTPTPVSGAHADGIQVRGVDGLTIENNVFDMGPWRQVGGQDVLNAAVFLQDANGGNRDVTVSGNYLNGAGYTIYLGVGPNTRFINNRFGRDEHYGLFRNTYNQGDLVESSGNVRDDNGASVLVP